MKYIAILSLSLLALYNCQSEPEPPTHMILLNGTRVESISNDISIREKELLEIIDDLYGELNRSYNTQDYWEVQSRVCNEYLNKISNALEGNGE